MNKAEILEYLTNEDDWNLVVEAFGNLEVEEIQEELESMFPHDIDNYDLATAIFTELRS